MLEAACLALGVNISPEIGGAERSIVCEMLRAVETGDEGAFAMLSAPETRYYFFRTAAPLPRGAGGGLDYTEAFRRASLAPLLVACPARFVQTPEPRLVSISWDCRAGYGVLITTFEVEGGRIRSVMTLPQPVAN